MFERPLPHEPEGGIAPESIQRDIAHYHAVLEKALAQGSLPNLPELEVFGTERVDRESIRVFAYSLVEFIEEKEQGADEESLALLYGLAQRIHVDLFSASPNLINHIQLPDRLMLMTRATRSNVIQGTFGSVFVGETVYDISFMGTRLDEIVLPMLRGLSISEQLDLLHQLRVVGAQAIANGAWSGSAHDQVRQVYERIQDSDEYSIFVRLSAESGIETLVREHEDPQLGVVRFEGQKNDSRLDSVFSDETIESFTKKFFSRYRVDRTFPSASKILPATKDASVFVDRSGLATGVVRMDVETLLVDDGVASGFDINQYQIYEQHLKKSEAIMKQRRDRVTVQIYRALYRELAEPFVAHRDLTGAAYLFAEILPVLNKSEWETYFIGEIKKQDLPEVNTLYREAGNKNEQATQEFIERLFDFRGKLGDRYEQCFIELEEVLESADLERAYDAATKVVLWCEYEKNPNKEHFEVVRLHKELQTTHRTNFENATEIYKTAVADLEQTDEMLAYALIAHKLYGALDDVRGQLGAFIRGKLETAQELPTLKYTSLKELVGELRDGHSTSAIDTEDVLLFQHVHSYELAGKIEKEFGFALADLTLKEQYFFLNYIKRVTRSSLNVIRDFTATHGVNGIRTFLSLERGDESLGDDIIVFGTRGEIAGRVFSYYGELLNSADHAERLVREVSDCTGNVCVDLADQVRENILNRAQKDLERVVRSGDSEEIALRIEGYIVKAKEYVALLQEVGVGDVERVLSTDLAPEDKDGMRSLLQRNYERLYPNTTDEQFKSAIGRSLEASFAKPDTVFCLLKDKGTIVSFNRFDTITRPDGSKVSYFGSFNADVAYNGVGAVVLETTISKRLEDGMPMVAHCDPTQPITKKYIESGFVATKFSPIEGKPSFEIWRVKDLEMMLISKKLTTGQLLGAQKTEDILIREVRKDDSYEELSAGKALSRFFMNEGKAYVVFEELPQQLRELFTLQTPEN